MGVSAALGIEGYKQFQLPPRYILYCWKKEFKIMQQIPSWKHLSVHIKYTHKGTVVHSTRGHWSARGDSEMKSLLGVGPMGSGSAGGTQGVWRSEQGRPAFYIGGRASVLFTFYIVFSCFLLSMCSSFSCRKGVVSRSTSFFTFSMGFF